MTIRSSLRVAFVAAWGTILAGGSCASAAVYFVDGACAASGTGVSLACGASGPFRTIGQGVLAMRPGDTLNVRGPHGTFDGVYFESLALRSGAAVPGQPLACTATQRCIIQGCRAVACPTDEQPIVRGMTRRSDWVAQAGGVWARTMEASPNPDGLERDPFDPHMLLQGTAAPFTPLAYAGDNTTPRDGAWSYAPATHQILVNPIGTADPAATVYVPHFAYNMHVQSPSANVTVQYLTFEGTRGRSIDVETLGSNHVTGVILSHLIQRYVPRYFIISTRSAPGLVIEDSLAEYGCRGFSWARTTNGGCMGYRLFGINGGIVRRNVIRHLGATGRVKFGGSGTAWPCPWCDVPWNDPSNTQNSAYGLAYQVKQTDTATVEDNRAEDIATGGISLDVSRRVTVQRNTVQRASTGVAMLNFTPTGGCPSTAPTEFCYNSDHVIRANVLDNVGYADTAGCGVTIIAGSERHVGASMLAQVYNNAISRVGFGGICVHNEGGTPTADLSIWNNTIYGARAVAGAAPSTGLMVSDATRNVVVRDNAFDGLTSDALDVTTAGAQGLSMDGDVIGTVSGCQVRWGSGSCDPLGAHEAHGRTGPLRFANVTLAPPDLHLTAGSAAIDAGVADGVTTDIDGDPRPRGVSWDAGADEFTGALVTTSTTSSTTTTSTSTSTTTTRPAGSSTSTSTSSTTRPSTSSTSTSPFTSTSTSTTTLVRRGCGNGLVETGEQCDDGNTHPLDGCDGTCRTEEVAIAASGTFLTTAIAPPNDPLAVTMVSPRAGRLVIVETSATTAPPPGFSFASRQVHTEAPRAAGTSPLVLRFTIDGALFGVPGLPAGLRMFRNGILAELCAGPAGQASPDPCVKDRVTSGPSQVRLTVLTSAGGDWNFGTAAAVTTGATIERCLAGTELLLQERPRRLQLRSRDSSQLTVGDGTDVQALLAEGGSLHVVAIGGDAFETTYPLPADGWRLFDPSTPSRGLRYRERLGPITSVVLEAGRILVVKGSGPGLAQSLGSDPTVVQVELRLGAYRYWLAFGGAPREFKANRKLLRRWATRPTVCAAAAP